MHKYSNIIFSLLFSFLMSITALFAQHPQVPGAPYAHKGVVKEVLQATSYTYLLMNENGTDMWIAVPKREAKVGETLYFSQGMPMTDFKSKDLNRTFENILFVGTIGSDPIKLAQTPAINNPHGKDKKVEAKEDIKIEPVKGGTSLETLFSDTKSFAGKTITVKGKVTKFNQAILGKNWIHLQDGTGAGDKHDLTITTDDFAHVGDIAVFKGKIVLNKDFGMGYSYDVIMEDAEKQ